MDAILFFVFLIFLPGAILNALGVIEFAFNVVGFLISAALTVVVLVVGFVFFVALLAH